MAEALKSGQAALAPLWREISGELQRLRLALAAELRDYPVPIPRCDAQFNHLYEQQARLARDRDRWSAMAEKGNYAKAVGEFIAALPYTDDPEERTLRARMKAAL
jgi:hypothetical protein